MRKHGKRGAAHACSGTTLKGLLREFKDYPGLVVNWIMFGSNGRMSRPPEGGTLRWYTQCNPKPNAHVKVIANTCCVANLPMPTPHNVYYKCVAHPAAAASRTPFAVCRVPCAVCCVSSTMHGQWRRKRCDHAEGGSSPRTVPDKPIPLAGFVRPRAQHAGVACWCQRQATEVAAGLYGRDLVPLPYRYLAGPNTTLHVRPVLSRLCAIPVGSCAACSGSIDR